MKNIDHSKDNSLKLALTNTLQFGDTDIFPMPYEYEILQYQSDTILEIFREKEYQTQSNSLHIEINKRGGGTRIATLIDPLLHLEYLSLAVEIAAVVESMRLPKTDNIVHSYRFNPDETTGKLFDKNYGFYSYRRACCEQKSISFRHRIVLDIKDFYQSISFDTLANVLKQNGIQLVQIERLKKIIEHINSHKHYGLPIGGNASRILAEILLNEIDKHLIAHDITFVRYVDDITIFSKKDEISDLLLIRQKLTELGLNINYEKLRIAEHSQTSFDNIFDTITYGDETGDEEEQQAEIILNKQIGKIREDKKVSAGLLELINSPAKINDFSLRLANNFGFLHSDFGRIARWILKHSDVLDFWVVEEIDILVLRLFKLKHSVLASPENRAFAIRLLGLQNTMRDETVGLLASEYINKCPLIRSAIVHVFRLCGCADFFNKSIENFKHIEPWERRAFVMAPEIRGKLTGEQFTLLENILINEN